MLKRRNLNPTAAEIEPYNLEESVGAMSYLMNWAQRTPPEYITRMNPEELIDKLTINLVEAGDKVDDLAHQHGEGHRSHEELEFFSEALKKLGRGQPVEANPFRVKKAP